MDIKDVFDEITERFSDLYRRIQQLEAAVTIPVGGGVGVHTILDGGVVHTDAALDVVTRGDIVVANATPAWDALAHPGAAGRVLVSTALDVAWSAASGITGSGTPNYLPIWTAATVLGNSLLRQVAGNLYTATNVELAGAVGDSPQLRFIGNSNLDTAYFYLDDKAGPLTSDMILVLVDNTGVTGLFIQDSTSATIISMYSDGRAEFLALGVGTTSGAVAGQIHVPDDGEVGVAADVRIIFDSSSGYVRVRLDDAIGADEFRVEDSGGVANAWINSDGDTQVDNLGIGAAPSGASGSLIVNTAVTVNAFGLGYVKSSAAGVQSISATVPLVDLASYTQGDIIYGGAADWQDLAIGGVYNILGVNAAGTEPEWQAFDWDNHIITAGGDGVHDHSNNNEGGLLPAGSLTHTVLNINYHTDSVTQAVTRGSMIYGNATPAWDELNHPAAAGYALTTDANDVIWDQTPTWTGQHLFSAGLKVSDDQDVVLGTDNDATIRYDEAGDDRVEVSGADWHWTVDNFDLLSAASSKPNLGIENTNADTVAPRIDFYKNSVSPADNDDLGFVNFYGETSTGAKERYALIFSESLDVTNGDTGGKLQFSVTMDATERNFLFLSGYNGVVNQGEIIFNEDAQDIDFRVEAVGVADAISIRGSDGQTTLGILTAGYVKSSAAGVLSVSTTVPLTDLASYTQGDLIYGGAADWQDLAIGAAYTLLAVNAAGTEPSWQLFDWDNHIITAGGDGVHNHSNNPEGGTLPAASISHTVLDNSVHTDTAAQAVTRGSLIYGNATPDWDELVHPGASRFLTTDAADVLWSANTFIINGNTTITGGGTISLGGFTLTVPATGTAALGTGGANRVAWWVNANTLSSDAGLQVDIINDLFIVADAGGIGNSNTTARLLFDSSGGTDYAYFSGCNVGIGTATPDETLHLLSSVSGEPTVLMENTNADASAPHMEFYKNSASPADGDNLGVIEFQGETSTGAKERYVYILGETVDVTNGDTAGRLSFVITMDATERQLLTLSGYNGSVNQGEVIINEIGQDVDLRVEASGLANALFLEGSSGTLYLNETSNANMAGPGITIRQGAADDEVFNVGSSDVEAVRNIVETNTFGVAKKVEGAAGGLKVQGFKDADGLNSQAILLQGYLAEAPDTTKSTAGRAIVELHGRQTDGTVDVNTAANGNVLGVRTTRGGASATLFIIDEDGDTWQAGNVLIEDGQYVGNDSTIRTIYDNANNVIIEHLNDVAGVDEWQVEDQASATVFRITSDGDAYCLDGAFIGVQAGVGWTFDDAGNELEASDHILLGANNHLRFLNANNIFYGNNNIIGETVGEITLYVDTNDTGAAGTHFFQIWEGDTLGGGGATQILGLQKDGDLNLPVGRIATAFTDYWDLEDYHAGAPTADGYVRVDINGSTYHLLAYAP